MKRRSLFLLVLMGFLIWYVNILLEPNDLASPIQRRIDKATTKILIYNRVPKSGSTHFASVLFNLSREHHRFKLISSGVNHPYRLTSGQLRKLEKKLLKSARKNPQQHVIYSRHMHLAMFNASSDVTFHYMNMLRDPLERSISHFDYLRSLCLIMKRRHRNCTSLDQSVIKMTMDQCVSTGDPARCISKPYGVRSFLSFFCGHEPMCDDAETPPSSDAAIALAKYNVERYYVVLGLLEYFHSSLQLFEYIAPDVFAGLSHQYMRFGSKIGAHRTSRKFRHKPNETTLAILRQLLRPEYELYEFIRQRFINQYTTSFRKSPVRE